MPSRLSPHGRATRLTPRLIPSLAPSLAPSLTPSLAAGLALAAWLAGSVGAHAQTNTQNGALNPAGNAPDSANLSGTIALVPMAALAKGQNSFTQGQAQTRLEGAGLTGVAGLALDADGIWRGKAMRGGKPVSVGFDFKGQMAAE